VAAKTPNVADEITIERFLVKQKIDKIM